MRRQLYFYTYLQGPPEDLAAVFAGDPRLWLPAPAEGRDGEWAVELDAGGTVPGQLGRHLARVTVDPVPVRGDGQLARRIGWRSASQNGWLPRLEGELELTRTSEHVSQLALFGSYRPPLSVVGAGVDGVYGHRVAEAVARAFVLAVAARLAASGVVA